LQFCRAFPCANASRLSQAMTGIELRWKRYVRSSQIIAHMHDGVHGLSISRRLIHSN
jgi:hypothetical protein